MTEIPRPSAQRWHTPPTPPMELVIAAARLHKPGDGDTFDLLVNFRRRRSWREAQVVNIRLAGYRAREKHQPAEVDPVTGEVIRVDGKEATRITTDVLTTSSLTLVEFTGDNDRGREICTVWVTLPEGQAPELLGAVLLARRVVLPGTTQGLGEDHDIHPA